MATLLVIRPPEGTITQKELRDLWDLKRLAARVQKDYERRLNAILARQLAGELIEPGAANVVEMPRRRTVK